jgi:RNA polymerase sigma factor (sigma-70 family)
MAGVDRGAGANPAYADDLELARQCAAGDERAWERFVLEYRPILYRAADALDPSGGARDLADSLYADLYGLGRTDGSTAGADRKPLLLYFHGRSSLATWLRAVLSQRFVDRVRAKRRIEPLADEDGSSYLASSGPPDPERAGDLRLIQRTLARAVADLSPKDRLRLACYYAQGLTLAETGRVLDEHEATASRQLARTRRAIREKVEQTLRDDDGLTDAQIARCFASVAEDAGPIDLDRMLAAAAECKETVPDRSKP